MVMDGMRIHAAVVQQEAHIVEVLDSRRGLGGSSSYGCRYCSTGLWLVAYIGLQH